MSSNEITPMLTDSLKEQMRAPSELAYKGELYFRVFDPDANRWLRLSSSVKMPIDRQLVNILDQLRLDYRFNLHGQRL